MSAFFSPGTTKEERERVLAILASIKNLRDVRPTLAPEDQPKVDDLIVFLESKLPDGIKGAFY